MATLNVNSQQDAVNQEFNTIHSNPNDSQPDWANLKRKLENTEKWAYPKSSLDKLNTVELVISDNNILVTLVPFVSIP